jgi:hypothetical protein
VSLDTRSPSSAIGFGEVDWFGNEQTGGQYGFIKEADGRDHFFMGKSCSDFHPVAGAIVVFELVPSSRHRGKFEAVNVRRISTIEDPDLLLHFAFLKEEYKPRNKHFRSLAQRYGEVVAQKQWSGPEILKHLADVGLLPKNLSQDNLLNAIKQPLTFLSAGLPVDMQDECLGLLLSSLSDADITASFFSKDLSYGRHSLDAMLREWPNLSESQHLSIIYSARSDPVHFLDRYAQFVIPSIYSDRSFNIVEHILDVLERLNWLKTNEAANALPESIVTIINNASIEQRLSAYHKSYLPLDRSMVRWFIRGWSKLTDQEKTRIVNDSQNSGIPILDDLVNQLLAPLAETQPYDAFRLLQDLIKYFPDDSEQLINQILHENEISIIEPLLWIYELKELENPLAYGEIVSGLTDEDQRLFLKKLVASMLTNQFALSVEELRKWVWTDISTWVVLEIIDGLQNRRPITSKGVIGHIIEHIDNPESDIVVDGYFDECPGRAFFSRDDELKRADAPRFVKWCEGRLLPPKKVNDGEKDDGRQRWWCANQVCMKPNIQERDPNEYPHFTLWNILKAFGINYNRCDYERLMATLNRIRQLMEKVRCRDCNHIMHPLNKKQSNYAFYRVNRFQCANPSCKNRDVVYLSHCINGNCSNIVDSRDSARCKPNNHEQQKCGWYICNYCLSCCTTEGLERRKYIMERTNQEYSCHLEGHRDRREICCPQCGTVMTRNSNDDFRKWISKHEADHRFVAKSSSRRDGGKWFLIKKTGFKDEKQFNSFIKHAHRCGYGIPDMDDQNKDMYLIGEPSGGRFAPILQCPNCDYDLNLNQIATEHDFQRLAALRIHDYINDIFPKQHQRT